MKKKMRWFGVVLMAALLAAGCGSKNEGVSDDELVSKDTFEGQYLMTAEEAKGKIGDENVLFVDCRGADKAKKETIEGAVSTHWKIGRASWGERVLIQV